MLGLRKRSIDVSESSISETSYIPFVNGITGSKYPKVDSSLTYNAGTDTLTTGTLSTTGASTMNSLVVTNTATIGTSLGVYGDLYVPFTSNLGVVNSGNHAVTGTLTTTGASTMNSLVVTNAATILGVLNSGNHAVTGTLGVTGTSNLTDTTDSTSTSTGALQISGGVGIAKNLNVGHQITTGGCFANDIMQIGPNAQGKFVSITPNYTSIEGGTLTVNGLSAICALRGEMKNSLSNAVPITWSVPANVKRITVTAIGVTSSTQQFISVNIGTGTYHKRLNYFHPAPASGSAVSGQLGFDFMYAGNTQNSNGSIVFTQINSAVWQAEGSVMDTALGWQLFSGGYTVLNNETTQVAILCSAGHITGGVFRVTFETF